MNPFFDVLARVGRWLALGAAVAFAPVSVAQEHVVFRFTLPASASSYPQQYAIDVGDTPGHAARIYEIERLFPPEVAAIDGVRIVRERVVGFSDYTAGDGPNSSYGVWYLADESRIFQTTIGTAYATQLGDGTTMRRAVGTGTITGGTGRFRGIRGRFRFNNEFNPATSVVDSNVTGEYWFEQ